MFTEFFYQIEDYLVYCRIKGLAHKTIQSYEQSLRLFARYCDDEHQVTKAEKVTKKMIVDYLAYVRDRGKYTVVR